MPITDNATVILTDADGNRFRASMEQANALAAMEQANKGGFATIIGYQPSSDYVVKPLHDYQVITRFDYGRLNNRKRDALEGITWNQVKDEILALPKVIELVKAKGEEHVRGIFNERKAKELDSIHVSAMGDRSDAHRQGHDRCYGRIVEGVRVHYKTEKVDGIMQPVFTDGLPTADSIMLNVLILSRNVREPGERKVVNSGVPVLISNVLKKQMNSRSVGFKALSLKPGNFEEVRMGGVTLNEADTARLGDLLIL
ncbi:hypothetical protein [Stenotrophomonas phage RAS14]